MHNSRYVWVNPERLQSAVGEAERFDGLELTIELSPYDLPQGIVGSYNEATGEFTITFEYIDDEPETRVSECEGIEIFAGIHSNKILRIAIHVDQPPHAGTAVIQLQTRVLGAIDRISQQKGQRNHEVAKRLLEDRFEDLVPA